MKLALLDTRRPDVDLALLTDYDALFRGGRAFHARARSLIPRRPDEHEKTYEHRIALAHYVNYAGPIVSRFAAWLFTGRLEIRSEPTDAPPYYAEIGEDCDGIGTDLTVFMRERLTRALVQKRAWILVDFPADVSAEPAATRADWDARGLGDGYLCPLDECDVIDWEVDERGELLFAVVKHEDRRRRAVDAGRNMVKASWTVWGRETWERYETVYEDGKPPRPEDEIVRVATGPVATKGRVPLVKIDLPDELWVMNLLASPQIEQMRARNAESWSLARTCYAMRIFKAEDRESMPVHGVGFGMMIGVNEDVKWDAPPSDAFTPIASYSDKLKDEMHRIASQIAYGVNNSAASVGRSAESKGQDNKLFDIVLGALGKVICEAVERVHDLLSLGRGETIDWHVSGLDAFDQENATEVLGNVVTAQTIGIPSPTFQRLLLRRAALTMVPDASDKERTQIVHEIDENTPDEIAEPSEPDEAADDGAEGDKQGGDMMDGPASERPTTPPPAG